MPLAETSDEGEVHPKVMSELPDLDEDVSFIVEGGASVGPISMRQITESVKTGQRAASSLVWWAGATDWVRFDSRPDLLALATPEAAVSQASVDTEARWGAQPGDGAEADPAQAEVDTPAQAEADTPAQAEVDAQIPAPVSYTHLTLPTIYSV